MESLENLILELSISSKQTAFKTSFGKQSVQFAHQNKW